MGTCTTLGEHNVCKGSWVCHDNIFIVLFFGSEHAATPGESSAFSFREVCRQSGVFMVWESRGRLLVYPLPLQEGKREGKTPHNLKLVL